MALTGLIFYQHMHVTPIKITDNCHPASIDKQTPLSLNSTLIASLVTGNWCHTFEVIMACIYKWEQHQWKGDSGELTFPSNIYKEGEYERPQWKFLNIYYLLFWPTSKTYQGYLG